MAPLLPLLLLATLRLGGVSGSTESPESALLARLGFKRAPRPPGAAAATEHLLHLYQILDEEGILPVRVGAQDTTRGHASTVVSHFLTSARSFSANNNQHTLFFNTSLENLSHEDEDVAVELRLFKESLPQGTARLTVSANDGEKLLEQRTLDLSQEGWESFDLTPWLKNRLHLTPTVRITVTVSNLSHNHSDQKVHLRRRRDVGPLAVEPQLVSYHRNKRAAVRHNRERRKKRKMRRQTSSFEQLPHVPPDLSVVCQKRPLYIRFRDVGWDSWIVAPEGFEAGLCSGQCPYPLSDVFNSTNHAIIQMLMHSVHPGQAAPPSCVPVKLSSKPILYLGNNNEVILKTYEDMEVDYCGCR